MNEIILPKNEPNPKDHVVVITAGIGLFLSTLDTGIINVALPTLVQAFHSTVTTIAWTVTLYTLALTGTIIVFGRLSDKYGRLSIYRWGLVLFAVSSVLCGFSRTANELIVFRTVQGIGAAMLQATAAAIITTTIPEERRGTALGTLGVLMGLGPVLGPSVGGLFISFGRWSWVFWINLPFAIVGLIGCHILSKTIPEKGNSIRLDVAGNLLLSISVLALLQGLSMWPSTGLSSALTFVPLGLFFVLFILFLVNEFRTTEPIVDLRLFRKGAFTAPVLAIFVFGGATSLGFIIPPYFLEQVSHLAPWQVGLVNLSSPLGLVLFSKVSGRLINRLGTSRLMVIGLVMMLMSYVILGQMQSNWNPWTLAVLLLLYGAGGGMFLPPNIAAIMGVVAKEMQGTIGAVQRMVQNLGIAVNTVVAASLILAHSHAGTEGLMSGFRQSWNYAAATIICSILVFLLISASRIIER